MALKRVAVLGALAAVAALVVGCSDNGVNPKTQTNNDRTDVTGTLTLEPQFLDDGYLDADIATNLGAAIRGARTPSSAGATMAAAIDPFTFWRRIASHTIAFEFAFADSDSTGRPNTATVTVRRTFNGTFNIALRNPNDPNTADPDPSHVIHKALLDRWVRQFVLKRVDVSGLHRPVWRLAAVSGVTVTSDNATSQITSVRLQSAVKDTTITDPTVLVPLRKTLRLTASDTVDVTVTTPRNDDVVYLYHAGGRTRLAGHGDGTYTGRFAPGVFTGWRHFAVNAMSHGTLFDDTAAYDSKAWVLAYVLVNGPSVDYLP